MDDSYNKIKKNKPTDFSFNIILICILCALGGLVLGTILGGVLEKHLHIVSELLGPLMALAAFIWGLYYSRRKYAEK